MKRLPALEISFVVAPADQSWGSGSRCSLTGQGSRQRHVAFVLRVAANRLFTACMRRCKLNVYTYILLYPDLARSKCIRI